MWHLRTKYPKDIWHPLCGIYIRNSNPGMEEDREIEEKIKLLMGKGKIKASKDLFNY